MKNLTVLLKSILLIAVAIVFTASTTRAQDMAKVATKNVKVLLDNEEVRVLDVQAKPGDKLPMHSHPANIVYAISAGKWKTMFPDGTSRDIEAKAGEARWSDAVTHANEALTETHVLVIELKQSKMMKKK